MNEKALLQAFCKILYGHMEGGGEDVAIEAEDWLSATEYLNEDYPRLSDLMRGVQEKRYIGSLVAEDQFEAALDAFGDANGLGDVYTAD